MHRVLFAVNGGEASSSSIFSQTLYQSVSKRARWLVNKTIPEKLHGNVSNRYLLPDCAHFCNKYFFLHFFVCVISNAIFLKKVFTLSKIRNIAKLEGKQHYDLFLFCFVLFESKYFVCESNQNELLSR